MFLNGTAEEILVLNQIFNNIVILRLMLGIFWTVVPIVL